MGSEPRIINKYKRNYSEHLVPKETIRLEPKVSFDTVRLISAIKISELKNQRPTKRMKSKKRSIKKLSKMPASRDRLFRSAELTGRVPLILISILFINSNLARVFAIPLLAPQYVNSSSFFKNPSSQVHTPATLPHHTNSNSNYHPQTNQLQIQTSQPNANHHHLELAPKPQLVSSPTGSECANGGLSSFELSTGFIYKPAASETLATLPSTLQLTDCLNFCLQNASCLAINYEVGLCVLLSSSARQNASQLFSSQFPVFTIYAEKICLLGTDPAAAAKQRRRCPRAWTFERVAGFEMKLKPKRRLKLATKELCMEACLGERDFECRSANWYRLSGECTLSDQDRHSVSQQQKQQAHIPAGASGPSGANTNGGNNPISSSNNAIWSGDQHPIVGHSSLSSSLYGPSNATAPTRPPAFPPGLYQNYYHASGAAKSLVLPSSSNGLEENNDQAEDHDLIARHSAPEVNSMPSNLITSNTTTSSRWPKRETGLLVGPRFGPAISDELIMTAGSGTQLDENSISVEYLENNCIQEPNKLCEFGKITNKVLKTVDSTYQDVGSLEECKQKCLSAPYRCYSFDYGDTAERVCRTSHLDQASLLTIKEPYLEVAGAVTYELTSCFNVTVQCKAREMLVQVSSSKSFKGRIYAKNRPNTCLNDVRNNLRFELSMRYHEPSCDVKLSAGKQQGIFSGDIVIQHHDRIVTSQDVGLSVFCQYDLSDRSIVSTVDLAVERLGTEIGDFSPSHNSSSSQFALNNGIESKTQNQQLGAGSSLTGAPSGGSASSPITITSLATTVVKSPNVIMKITNMNGNPVNSATVGDRLALMFEIKEKTTPFGIFVRDIIAMDGKQMVVQQQKQPTNNTNTKLTSANNNNDLDELISANLAANVGQTIQLINEDGCPTDANIMGHLVKLDPAGRKFLAPFDAFKFPSSDVVFFRAVITTCLAECRPSSCQTAPSQAAGSSLNLAFAASSNEEDLAFGSTTGLTNRSMLSIPGPVSANTNKLNTPNQIQSFSYINNYSSNQSHNSNHGVNQIDSNLATTRNLAIGNEVRGNWQPEDSSPSMNIHSSSQTLTTATSFQTASPPPTPGSAAAAAVQSATEASTPVVADSESLDSSENRKPLGSRPTDSSITVPGFSNDNNPMTGSQSKPQGAPMGNKTNDRNDASTMAANWQSRPNHESPIEDPSSKGQSVAPVDAPIEILNEYQRDLLIKLLKETRRRVANELVTSSTPTQLNLNQSSAIEGKRFDANSPPLEMNDEMNNLESITNQQASSNSNKQSGQSLMQQIDQLISRLEAHKPASTGGPAAKQRELQSLDGTSSQGNNKLQLDDELDMNEITTILVPTMLLSASASAASTSSPRAAGAANQSSAALVQGLGYEATTSSQLSESTLAPAAQSSGPISIPIGDGVPQSQSLSGSPFSAIELQSFDKALQNVVDEQLNKLDRVARELKDTANRTESSNRRRRRWAVNSIDCSEQDNDELGGLLSNENNNKFIHRIYRQHSNWAPLDDSLFRSLLATSGAHEPATNQRLLVKRQAASQADQSSSDNHDDDSAQLVQSIKIVDRLEFDNEQQEKAKIKSKPRSNLRLPAARKNSLVSSNMNNNGSGIIKHKNNQLITTHSATSKGGHLSSNAGVLDSPDYTNPMRSSYSDDSDQADLMSNHGGSPFDKLDEPVSSLRSGRWSSLTTLVVVASCSFVVLQFLLIFSFTYWFPSFSSSSSSSNSAAQQKTDNIPQFHPQQHQSPSPVFPFNPSPAASSPSLVSTSSSCGPLLWSHNHNKHHQLMPLPVYPANTPLVAGWGRRQMGPPPGRARLSRGIVNFCH